MTETWTADQSMWPAHLRDDAPSQQCGRCGRTTRSPGEFDRECRMPQPDGYPCGGRFESPGILLDLYDARIGEPVPTDTTTPLPNAYVWLGKGRVRLTYPEPQEMGGPILRTVAGNPHLIIQWEERRPTWSGPDTGRASLPFVVIVGEATNPDGRQVRMVAHRTGRTENELHLGKATTTVNLHRDDTSGDVVTWYYRKTRPAVGETWRGMVHGGLLKVTEVDDDWVHCLVVYAGNPYLAAEVGSVIRLSRPHWHEFMEYPPEWNEPTTRPGGA